MPSCDAPDGIFATDLGRSRPAWRSFWVRATYRLPGLPRFSRAWSAPCVRWHFANYRRNRSVTQKAPRAFNREMYHDHRENVFYGTDDGRQDGSFTEFADFKAHYESVGKARREDIHMISVVGGLYGLNLIPLWRP